MEVYQCFSVTPIKLAQIISRNTAVENQVSFNRWYAGFTNLGKLKGVRITVTRDHDAPDSDVKRLLVSHT